MSYKSEILEKLKNNSNSIEPYNITAGNGYVVVEGHKGLLQFDSAKVVVKLKKGSVSIVGDGLVIASSQSKELVVKGAIKNINFEGV